MANNFRVTFTLTAATHLASIHALAAASADLGVWHDFRAARLRDGFRSSDHLLDLAIDGAGMFALQFAGDEQLAYTRRGEFRLDRHGYLVHKNSGGYLLGWVDGVLAPINLTQAAHRQDSDTAALKAFKTTPDGTISAMYDDGVDLPLANIVLADFAQPGALQLIADHLLAETAASGPARLARPGDQARGTIIAAALEDPASH